MRYKVMDYLTRPRLNYLDLCWMSSFMGLVMTGRIVAGLVVCILGAFTSVMLEKISRNALLDKFAAEQRKREKIWQDRADAGYRIEAIKLHREIYGSTLKEAMHAVDMHIGQRKN